MSNRVVPTTFQEEVVSTTSHHSILEEESLHEESPPKILTTEEKELFKNIDKEEQDIYLAIKRMYPNLFKNDPEQLLEFIRYSTDPMIDVVQPVYITIMI